MAVRLEDKRTETVGSYTDAVLKGFIPTPAENKII